jgi:hypothetical protein
MRYEINKAGTMKISHAQPIALLCKTEYGMAGTIARKIPITNIRVLSPRIYYLFSKK